MLVGTVVGGLGVQREGEREGGRQQGNRIEKKREKRALGGLELSDRAG